MHRRGPRSRRGGKGFVYGLGYLLRPSHQRRICAYGPSECNLVKILKSAPAKLGRVARSRDEQQRGSVDMGVQDASQGVNVSHTTAYCADAHPTC
jgi:hypothetical protein